MKGKICSRKERCVVGNKPQPMENYSKRLLAKDGIHETCKSCLTQMALDCRKRKQEREKEFKEMFF